MRRVVDEWERAFNPTLVRLGPTSRCPAKGRDTPFNPTLVRLGQRGGGVQLLASPGFQSHFGSIGARIARRGRPRWPPFQSHFGSIGASAVGEAAGEGLSAFQSHFGSIGASPRWGSGGRLHDLSIPLWFDWGDLGGAIGRQLHAPFNPTLVRLGLDPLNAIVTVATLFQSHFGSIGAPRQQWLPRRRIELSIPLWFDWGGASSTASLSSPQPFNPTLVRLGRGRH